MKLISIVVSCLILISCNQEQAEFLKYERVIDGDTFIASGKRIRLWGIDAPEKNEPEAYASKLYLEVILEKGELRCEFKHMDRYKREVMQCYSNGSDVATDLVKNGMAKDYPRYSNGFYNSAEKEAKSKKLGIWSGSRI